MAECIEKSAVLNALASEGITRNMRVFRKTQDIPAGDVAPVRHWRWDKAGYSLARCSFCHTVRKTDFVRDHYCPNCGAKMDRKEAAADEQKP